MPPPADRGGSADPQPAQLWWPGLGAARLGEVGRTDGQTDGSRHRLIPPHELCTFTAVLRSTQPSTLRGTVK